jgi:hypothetical protein
MPTIRILAAATTLAAAVIGASPRGAAAQDTGPQPYRFTIEGYLANYFAYDRGPGGDRASIGGYGVRVMFNRSTVARAARSFFDRASAGAFATFTGKQDGVSTQHIGGEVDVSLLPAPVAGGLIDPFVSLGVGALRSSYDAPNVPSSTDLSIIPAAGTRIPLFSGIGFRGDLRAPLVFSDGDTRVHLLAEGGIYLSF